MLLVLRYGMAAILAALAVSPAYAAPATSVPIDTLVALRRWVEPQTKIEVIQVFEWIKGSPAAGEFDVPTQTALSYLSPNGPHAGFFWKTPAQRSYYRLRATPSVTTPEVSYFLGHFQFSVYSPDDFFTIALHGSSPDRELSVRIGDQSIGFAPDLDYAPKSVPPLAEVNIFPTARPRTLGNIFRVQHAEPKFVMLEHELSATLQKRPSQILIFNPITKTTHGVPIARVFQKLGVQLSHEQKVSPDRTHTDITVYETANGMRLGVSDQHGNFAQWTQEDGPTTYLHKYIGNSRAESLLAALHDVEQHGFRPDAHYPAVRLTSPCAFFLKLLGEAP